GPGLGGAAAAALLAATLPWLHLKMLPAAMALAAIAAVRLRGRTRAAFFAVASPLALYGGMPRDADGSPLRALVGLALDRSFGLLPYAPVFLIALSGAACLVRRRAWEWLLV